MDLAELEGYSPHYRTLFSALVDGRIPESSEFGRGAWRAFSRLFRNYERQPEQTLSYMNEGLAATGLIDRGIPVQKAPTLRPAEFHTGIRGRAKPLELVLAEEVKRMAFTPDVPPFIEIE